MYESLMIENNSLNKLYKTVVNKMKRMQSEYESMYLNYLSENQQRENSIKNNFSKYQELLQKQYKNEEKNYLEEINNLKKEIIEKNSLIIALQKNNSMLKDKLTKNELVFHLKEKEYQKELLNKDRLLMKSSDIVKQNSKEVMEDIQKLKDELKYFQNKIYFMNNNQNMSDNNFNPINNNQDLKYYNPELSNMNECNCHCHKNRSELNKSFYSLQYPNLNQRKTVLYNNMKDDNNSNDIYCLKSKIKHLNNVIKKKDEEILFWKNLRKDLYLYTNKTDNNQNCKNILKNFKFEVNKKNKILSNINNTSSSKKNYNRSYSHSSSQFRPFRRKMNLNLVDSNISKTIKKNNVSSEEKKK